MCELVVGSHICAPGKRHVSDHLLPLQLISGLVPTKEKTGSTSNRSPLLLLGGAFKLILLANHDSALGNLEGNSRFFRFHLAQFSDVMKIRIHGGGGVLEPVLKFQFLKS